MTKTMNHAAYMKSLRTKTQDELLFIIHDAGESAELGGENAGYYMDEAHYARMRLRDLITIDCMKNYPSRPL